MKVCNGDWRSYSDRLNSILNALSIRDASGREIDHASGMSLWREKTLRVRDLKKTIYFAGNGASASMASHFSADLQKNGRIHTSVFTELSLMTAYANDLSYDEVFAAPLRLWMQTDDMLVVISSSGESINLLQAVRAARDIGGGIVTLTAMSPENSLRQSGDINLYIPADTYGMAETAHAALLHYWADMLIGES